MYCRYTKQAFRTTLDGGESFIQSVLFQRFFALIFFSWCCLNTAYFYMASTTQFGV